MGDYRFEAAYDAIVGADDRTAAIRALSDEEVVHALAAASRRNDPYVANVLATEILNRQRRRTALFTGLLLGSAFALGTRTILLAVFAVSPHDWSDVVQFAATTLLLLGGGVVAFATYVRQRRRPTGRERREARSGSRDARPGRRNARSDE